MELLAMYQTIFIYFYFLNYFLCKKRVFFIGSKQTESEILFFIAYNQIYWLFFNAE